ncbi:MAG: ATP-binding cassette domain-containing protein [Planctomycetota bacterium]
MSKPSDEHNEITRPLVSPWSEIPDKSDAPWRFKLVPLINRKPELLIGRNPDSDIWIDHPAVSRTHASLSMRADGRLIVRDMGSTHGVTLDGKSVTGEAVWETGATLHLGPQALWIEDGKNLVVTTRRGSPNLEAVGLTVRVAGREKPILDRVSFSFKPGEFVCILGPSGAGKSTLVKCMQGLQSTSGGSLLFGGNPFLSNPTIINGLIGYAPQQMSLHETLTVRQVVWFAAKLRLPTDTSPEEIETHVDSALRSMGVDRLGGQTISSLSGGERKRVELASELVVNPSILVVDEATSSLDPASEARVMEVLAETARRGKLVLCVTHHLDNISKADTLLVLSDGKVVYLGPPGGACAHFGVENLSDAFVRLEDEGSDKWAATENGATPDDGSTGASAQKTGGAAIQRRSVGARLRECIRQAGILTRRECASVLSDRRFLFLAALMPAIFALIVIAGHWISDFSKPILLTRNLNDEEKEAFSAFWPVIHRAAQGTLDEDDNLSIKAQLAYLFSVKPAMRKNLASDDLDRIVTGAIDGTETVFPDRFIKNHITTLKYLSVQMMGLSFMGMLLGLTLMVRDGDIFPREKSAGLLPLAYLLSKLAILLLATGFQTIVFDGILEALFEVRQWTNRLDPVPADYRIAFPPMLLVHWVTTLGCGCLGVLLGSITRKPDRSIILLGAMMLPQLILGSALGLAAAPMPKAVAFVTSPTYWGLRATQLSPMENGIVALPSHMWIFGESFIQSVPLALAGLAAQIILYLFLGWLLLRRSKPASSD